MTKIPKDKRDKIILISVATLVVVGALWFLLINAQQGMLKRALTEAKKSREQLEGGQRTVKEQAASQRSRTSQRRQVPCKRQTRSCGGIS